jgi:hypothetical protein
LQRSIVQRLAAVAGSAFLIAGIAGGIMAGVGRSGCEVSVTGTVVHVVLGGTGWLLSGNFTLARAYLVVGGLAYLVLSLAGVVGGHVVLQAGLSAAMIVCGVWLSRRPGDGASGG